MQLETEGIHSFIESHCLAYSFIHEIQLFPSSVRQARDSGRERDCQAYYINEVKPSLSLYDRRRSLSLAEIFGISTFSIELWSKADVCSYTIGVFVLNIFGQENQPKKLGRFFKKNLSFFCFAL